MLKNKKPLLKMQFFTWMGQSAIGIFFPFFVQKSFGLEIWQIILWFAFVHLMMGLLVYPINKRGINQFGMRGMIQIGLIYNAIFYLVLATELNNIWAFILLNFSFILFLCCFWPSFNCITTLSTMDKTRGEHIGNFQIIAVSSSLIAPVITGFLLEWGQAQWSLIFSIICFLIGVFLVKKIEPTYTKIESDEAFKKIFKETILHREKVWGFIGEMVVGITMWILWPLYFKAVVGKFSLMGLITAAMAFVEIFVTRWMGKLTDRISASKTLFWGCWARFADLSLRASYIFFKPLWFIGFIQLMGTILGPIFQIAAISRVFELGVEKHPKNLIEFFLAREIFLGLTRFLFLVPVAGIIYLTDVIWLGLVFIFSGLWAFGLRKF